MVGPSWQGDGRPILAGGVSGSGQADAPPRAGRASATLAGAPRDDAPAAQHPAALDGHPPVVAAGEANRTGGARAAERGSGLTPHDGRRMVDGWSTSPRFQLPRAFSPTGRFRCNSRHFVALVRARRRALRPLFRIMSPLLWPLSFRPVDGSVEFMRSTSEIAARSRKSRFGDYANRG